METINKSDKYSDIQYLKSKRQKALDGLEKFSFSKRMLALYTVIGACLGALCALVIFSIKDSSGWSNYYNITILIGAIAGSVLYMSATEVFRLKALRKLSWVEYKLAQQGAEELQEKMEEDFFTKLVQINFKYIDKYYLQTQEQANKSFRLCKTVGSIGFIVLIAGIFLLYNDRSQSTAAYITTTAGVISEFIAAVFFYLYNQTILKMAEYHQKLVITQNISLALKITDKMDEPTKSKSLEMLIDRLTLDVNKYLSE